MRWARLLVLLGVLACGASQRIVVEHEAVGDLAGRTTYAFSDQPGEVVQGYATGHLFNSIMQRRIEDELRKALAAKGYTEAGADQAGLLIAFTTGARQDVMGAPAQTQGVVQGPAYTEDRGTLVLHFLDPQSKGALWRGEAMGVVKPSDDFDVRVRGAVREIMKDFPAAG